MKISQPIQRFVNEGLHSKLNTIADEYSNIINGQPQDFYDLLSENQRMDKLPDALLIIFANRVRELTNDYDSDTEELMMTIKDLLVEYDEEFLDQKNVTKEMKQKQLSYFREKSELLNDTIDQMSGFENRAFFLNMPDKQAYYLTFDKNIAIGYVPSGQINGIARSRFTIVQGYTSIVTMHEDAMDQESLSEILRQVKAFLEDDNEETFYIKGMYDDQITYIRGSYRGTSKASLV